MGQRAPAIRFEQTAVRVIGPYPALLDAGDLGVIFRGISIPSVAISEHYSTFRSIESRARRP